MTQNGDALIYRKQRIFSNGNLVLNLMKVLKKPLSTLRKRRVCQVNREDELIKAGWEKRFIACEPRLSEMVEMYKEIGLTVHLEPLPAKEDIEQEDVKNCADTCCTVCFDADRERYRIIFTKPTGNK